MVNGSGERHGTDHCRRRHRRSSYTGVVNTTTHNYVVVPHSGNYGHIAAMQGPGFHGSGADLSHLSIDPS